MKILCVSDTVVPQLESTANLRRHYSDIELIISCGDMKVDYLEFIQTILNVPLLYVRGNHDEEYIQKPPSGDDLHQQLLIYQGLSLYGLEGCLRYNSSPIQFTQSELELQVMGAAPILMWNQLVRSGLDILVTHAPPRGIHDLEDRPHQGFKGLLRFMNWYKPRYLLHGHVHTWDRRRVVRSQYKQTCIINVNPFTVLEIEARQSP